MVVPCRLQHTQMDVCLGERKGNGNNSFIHSFTHAYTHAYIPSSKPCSPCPTRGEYSLSQFVTLQYLLSIFDKQSLGNEGKGKQTSIMNKLCEQASSLLACFPTDKTLLSLTRISSDRDGGYIPRLQLLQHFR